MKTSRMLLLGRKPLSVRTNMLTWNRPNMNGGTDEAGGNVKKRWRESWHEPWANSGRKLSAEWETRRPYPEVSSQDGCVFSVSGGWRYFTSITVQFILLKLFFRETQKERVYYRCDCLQRFTSHRICRYTKNRNCLEKPQYGQTWHSEGVASPISLTWRCMRCIFELWITSPISSGIIFHFIYMTPSRRRRQHQKRQTSNTILTQATSNEAQTVSGIKGPGRFFCKTLVRETPNGLFNSLMSCTKGCKHSRVPRVCAETKAQGIAYAGSPHLTPMFIANKHSKNVQLTE